MPCTQTLCRDMRLIKATEASQYRLEWLAIFLAYPICVEKGLRLQTHRIYTGMLG